VDLDRKLLSIELSPKSAFWPKGNERPLGVVAGTLGFDVYVRRRQIDLEIFQPFMSVEGGKGGDWIAPTILPQDRENVLSFRPKTKALEVMGTTHYDKKLWRNNGRVTSISDLLGAQVILVQRHGVGMTKNSNPYERSNASQNGLSHD